ncbi:DUF892 family protein [Mucilaginibacter glaciei]|nr:DUF892 family protein [Mucilaginibacter glaciei]
MELVKDKSPEFNLGADQLRIFFIDHLNRIYCAKEHLVNRLPEIIEDANFSDLKYAIEETLTDVEAQISRMDEVYILLDAEKSFANCDGLINFIDESFDCIFKQVSDAAIRDMSILSYMINIESMELASFKVLQLIAGKFENKQIKQLLKENFDEATADRALLLLILVKYMKD